MAKKRIFTKRDGVQALATVATNFHLPNFLSGKIYQGSGKYACVPGLNCYSCPGAAGACPIGSFQAVVGSSKFHLTFYVTGILILFGVTMGRFICGFLCPFGWFQDLLHKIPVKKLSTKKIWFLRYLKYVILVGAVILLPMFASNELGMGNPYFCKYVCPQGILEGAIPLSLSNVSIRNALGSLFLFKGAVLMSIVILSMIFYRPFCKWICPLGAIYALFNKISLLRYEFHEERCVKCGKCVKACHMDVDITKHTAHNECIRCTECVKACSTDAITIHWGLAKNKYDLPNDLGRVSTKEGLS